MEEKHDIEFYDIQNGVSLGSSVIPSMSIQKLNRGDIIEFKDSATLFGQYIIESFAVNSGSIEGRISLKPLKINAKIKLQRINDKYLDSLLPF